RIDSPTAAAEPMEEQRRDRAEFEIGGVKVGALWRHHGLTCGSMIIFFADGGAALVLDAKCFDDADHALGDRPIDRRQVPPAKLLVRLVGDAAGISLSETFGLA